MLSSLNHLPKQCSCQTDELLFPQAEAGTALGHLVVEAGTKLLHQLAEAGRPQRRVHVLVRVAVPGVQIKPQGAREYRGLLWGVE